jgi:hypothetical protein
MKRLRAVVRLNIMADRPQVFEVQLSPDLSLDKRGKIGAVVFPPPINTGRFQLDVKILNFKI